jgi:hypothetical protein
MKKSSGRGGFTLVETLVAAGVIALSLLSVVAFVRKGQEMISLEKHRAMARGIIAGKIEQQPYQSQSYDKLTTITVPTPTTVVIDSGTHINGALAVAVGAEVAQVNGIDAPHRVITATVTWTEPGGGNQTVSIDKWVANVQRN